MATSSSSERFRLEQRSPVARGGSDVACDGGGEHGVGMECADVGGEGRLSRVGCGCLRGSWESQQTTLDECCCVGMNKGEYIDGQGFSA